MLEPGDANLAGLLTTLQQLKTFPNAAEAYRAKLLELAQSPIQPHVSGLGLVRIAYEGNCTIRADVTESTVCVTADMILSRPENSKP